MLTIRDCGFNANLGKAAHQDDTSLQAVVPWGPKEAAGGGGWPGVRPTSSRRAGESVALFFGCVRASMPQASQRTGWIHA